MDYLIYTENIPSNIIIKKIDTLINIEENYDLQYIFNNIVENFSDLYTIEIDNLKSEVSLINKIKNKYIFMKFFNNNTIKDKSKIVLEITLKHHLNIDDYDFLMRLEKQKWIKMDKNE